MAKIAANPEKYIFDGALEVASELRMITKVNSYLMEKGFFYVKRMGSTVNTIKVMILI